MNEPSDRAVMSAGVAAVSLLPVLTGRRCRQADEGRNKHFRIDAAPHPYPLPVHGERGAGASPPIADPSMNHGPSAGSFRGCRVTVSHTNGLSKELPA